MIPLFNINQIREADNYAFQHYGLPTILLMENAAESIVSEIKNRFPSISKKNIISIICGKGNNGGDGFAVARKFAVDGFDVKVLALADENNLAGDAKTNFEILKKINKDYKNLSIKIFSKISDLIFIKKSDFIIDAILGTGSIGKLKDPYDKIVEELNKFKCVKIAIDSPTGLNMENASGEIIFKSDLTITLADFKTGLFYEKGKLNSGEIVKGSIGIGSNYFDKQDVTEYLIEPEDAFIELPQKRIDLNKYSAGKVLVIAGSGKMPGAAIFSMNAAMISGTGAGFLVFPKSIKRVAQTKMNSAIVLSYEDEKNEYLQLKNLNELEAKINWADVILIGPGLGREEETQKFILEFLQKYSHKKIVIDADAIYAIRNKKYKKLNLGNIVFTPHHKEFADLIGVELEDLKMNLLKFGKQFVKETKSYLVLKSEQTLIFNPFGEVFFNSTGNAGLAKFGSGDVLSGIISSFIAQTKNVENSLISSVYLHGLTADLIVKNESEFGITPNKIINNFPKTIKFLRNSLV
jgi:ADP-dependent NAD(P)H-hydrate dehydratase / NAD(P)H-hydrate epimerase